MKTTSGFGVFDGLHKGHKFFLKEAKKRGDRLFVILARDEVVRKLKGHPPRFPFKKRAAFLEKERAVAKVFRGDRKPGSYRVLRSIKPDIIAVGYDQRAFEKDLRKCVRCFSWRPKIVKIRSFKPSVYHTRLLSG